MPGGDRATSTTSIAGPSAASRDASDFLLFCDEPADQDLFNSLKPRRPGLSQIPDGNVVVYPQAAGSAALTEVMERIRPLHQDDRPDWVFCFKGQPVLVVELTEHAYTGDQGLQRFARFAAAAEHKVPFVYFGPLSRVRDDELDNVENGGQANARRLTSDLFEGMSTLSQIYNVPQLYVPWITGANGKPAKLPIRATLAQTENIYGALLDTLELLLFKAPLAGGGSPGSNAGVAALQQKTSTLALERNTRESDVKFAFDVARLQQLLKAPKSLVGALASSNYFAKGKPDKLFALHALNISKPSTVQYPDGTTELLTDQRLRDLIQWIVRLPRFSKPGTAYYSGYKWRSDPHGGVLVNIDYRLCRLDQPRTIRSRPLVMVYPRIVLNREGVVWKTLAQVLRDPNFKALFVNRYGKDADAKMAMVIASNNFYGVWTNTTKQARLFRRYSDVIILSDGFVLGDSLRADFQNWPRA